MKLRLEARVSSDSPNLPTSKRPTADWCVRLFEAFVSYKQAGVKSDHRREAGLMRDVVRDPKNRLVQIVPADQFKERDGDELISATSW